MYSCLNELSVLWTMSVDVFLSMFSDVGQFTGSNPNQGTIFLV